MSRLDTSSGRLDMHSFQHCVPPGAVIESAKIGVVSSSLLNIAIDYEATSTMELPLLSSTPRTCRWYSLRYISQWSWLCGNSLFPCWTGVWLPGLNHSAVMSMHLQAVRVRCYGASRVRTPQNLHSCRRLVQSACPNALDLWTGTPSPDFAAPVPAPEPPSPAPKRNPTLRWDWLTSQVQVSLAGPGVVGLALNQHGPQLSHLATSPLFSRRPSACILPFPIFPSLSPKGQEHGQRLPPLPFLS